MNGWIKLHRTAFDHDMFSGRPDWLGAWVMLLMKADHETGQLRASLVTLQGWFDWTPKRVRVFLQKLEDSGMIDRAPNEAKKGTKGAQITICNYSKFQHGENQQGTKGVPDGAAKGHIIKKEEEEIRRTATAVQGRRAPMAKQMDLPTDMDPDLEHIRQTWNAYAKDTGKAQVRKLTKDRRDRIRQVMDDNHYTIDDFNEAMEMANRSDYLVEQGWFTFDWIWKADSNLSKVCEGNYGNGRHSEPDFMNGMSPKEYQQHLLSGGV